jgi:hypothetical protein
MHGTYVKKKLYIYITLTVACSSATYTEPIMAFLLRQWLRERVPVLRLHTLPISLVLFLRREVVILPPDLIVEAVRHFEHTQRSVL